VSLRAYAAAGWATTSVACSVLLAAIRFDNRPDDALLGRWLSDRFFADAWSQQVVLFIEEKQ
jgi:hypothetical protein